MDSTEGAINGEPSRLLAIRSSSYRYRTHDDRKTDRAFHLLRFAGTSQERPAPPSAQDAKPPRVRRELVERPVNEPTEEEKRQGLTTRGRRPGETEEAYEARLRTLRNLRNRPNEFQWVLEDSRRENRWEGKEDLTQDSHYVVMFPPSEPGAPMKVALIDQWIEMRKFVDTSAQRQKVQDEMKRKQIQANMKALRQAVVEKKDEGKTRRLVDRDSALEVYTGKRYKQTGAVDRDDDDGTGGIRRSNYEFGVDVDDIAAEDDKVDHEHGLAIDRMKTDGEEFYDDDYEFDDDDDIEEDQVAAQDKTGLADGAVILEEAEREDEEGSEVDEDEEDDDDDDQKRPQSSSEDDEEDEDEEEEEEDAPPVRAPSRPSIVPITATVKPPVALPAATAPPSSAAPQLAAKSGGSLEQRMRAYIKELILAKSNKLRLEEFGQAMKTQFGAEFDRTLMRKLVSEMCTIGNDLNVDYLALKDAYAFSDS